MSADESDPWSEVIIRVSGVDLRPRCGLGLLRNESLLITWSRATLPVGSAHEDGPQGARDLDSVRLIIPKTLVAMRYLTRCLVITSALCVSAVVPAFGQGERLITDRPDQTESAAIVSPQHVQLEMGWTFSQVGTLDFRTRAHALLGALARIGVGERLEVRVGFAGWMFEDNTPPTGQSFDRSGAGDIDVGFKLKLVDAQLGRPDVAVIGTVGLPTGEAPFQRLRADPAVRLAFANELGDGVGIGYNVGVEWNTECDPRAADACVEQTFADYVYTVAFGFAVSERLSAFAESFGTVEFNDGRTSAHALDGGFTYLLRDNLQLDASGGIGLNDAAGDWFVGAGVSVRLPK